MHREQNSRLPLGLSLQHETPSHRKNVPSATFTSPSALWGQRPRGAHGPSAAFQDGQPPALASPAVGQLPGARVNKQRPHCPRVCMGQGWVLFAQDPELHRGDCRHIRSSDPLASFQNYFQLWEHFPVPSGVSISRSVLRCWALGRRKAADQFWGPGRGLSREGRGSGCPSPAG